MNYLSTPIVENSSRVDEVMNSEPEDISLREVSVLSRDGGMCGCMKLG
jgi:hypothetical protein